MMKEIVFVVLLALTCPVIGQTTITKNPGSFSALKVYNGLALELIKSDTQRLEITGEKAEKVRVKNVNDVLKIFLPFSLKPSNNLADDTTLVKLYYVEDILVIDANESATITGSGLSQNTLKVNSQERGFINLTVEVKYLEVRASSGGIIKLSGTAKNQEVDLDLYGIYHGFGLKSVHNSIVKSGTGAKAEIFAGEMLKAKVSFGGTIFYKGVPEVIKDKKVIGGIIQKRN